MNAFQSRHRRQSGICAAAWLLAWMLGCIVGPVPDASAADIYNTAVVSYRLDGSTDTSSLQSNTVRTQVQMPPASAQLAFLGDASSIPGRQPTAIDGGQCRVDGGSFAPLPGVVGSDGQPLDPRNALVGQTADYDIGAPIVVSVVDPGRNADPAVREYVDVDVTTTSGDAETLRLQETGVDTGVFAAAIRGMAMPPAAGRYDCVLSLVDGSQITARYVGADAQSGTLTTIATAHGAAPTDIRLDQIASRDIIEIGDFIQYTLVVYNVAQGAATSVEIRDVLPPGLRYRAGTLRVGDPYQGSPSQGTLNRTPAGGAGPRASAAGIRRAVLPKAGPIEPIMQAGGREMLFNVGDLAPGEAIRATFVAEVVGGSNGERLVNYAIATANGAYSSNETDTVVRMVESLGVLRFTLAGRVMLAESCDAPQDQHKGAPNVRLLLEDGTYVNTDANGAYHFEGLRPGTHVVQLDTAVLPADLEPVACQRNTRFAGRADSQFVESQGGMLQRADFYLRRKPPVVSELGIRVAVPTRADGSRLAIELDGGPAEVSKVRAIVMLPAGVAYVPGSATLDGDAFADPSMAGNTAVFDLGDPGGNWRRRIEFATRSDACPQPDTPVKAVAVFQAEGKSGLRTPPALLALPCGPPPGEVASDRAAASVAAISQGVAASPFAAQAKARDAILTDSVASGATQGDWFAGQAPGRDWLFPGVGHNPRAPIILVVLKHLPGDTVRLLVNGQEVSARNFDGRNRNAARTMAVSLWRGIGLAGGDNLLQAEITDASGNRVATLQRTVHFANAAASAELVPEQSILVADGMHRPVLAVRLRDASGQPLRHGMTGKYTITAPYAPAYAAGVEQARQFIGTSDGAPTWKVEGDDGIAYIELEPTSVAGSFTLGFTFGSNEDNRRIQQIQGWLKAAPRDWVVVGFAKGSIGYETLQDNMQALPPGEDGAGMRGDGQASFYAKGRVLGKWLLTLAYDSDKDTGRLRNQGLLSTIDPGQYYTLYGDGAQQGYDASSARKLYLKLERDQFYVLFGDFQSGMDRTELSRYQRTLNGMKVAYRGPLLDVNGFAAETSQNYIRDEIQGDGTSGLYRLRQRSIVLNSERIRIETRDRYHSEQILGSRELVRHIDYDIDYDNGTLFFREPIASRDFEFNPNWIVVEYETRGTGEEFLNGGARVGVHAMQGRLEAGVSYIRDEDAQSRNQLAGVDAKFHLTARDELRAEVAATRSERGPADSEGTAWLLEWEHRGEQWNLLAYARRNSPGFGLGQQNRYQAGMFKTGVQGQYKLGKDFSLQGELYRQEDLTSGAVRDAGRVETIYQGDGWTANAGLQWARDQAAGGDAVESRQVTLGANKSFLDRRLDLGLRADFSLPGKNESVDFPTRLQLTAAYEVSEAFRVLAAQEFTDGKDRDTSTTRVGFEARPWRDATLTSTVNQSQVSEYGPRTFALFGLSQKFRASQNWSFDVALDSSRAFNESGNAPLVVDPSQPIQAGGIRDGGALTEDFVAVSGGTTYSTDLWMWNARVEARSSDSNDRYGFTSAFLRQVRDGVALSASAQAFSQRNADGSTGILANAQFSWAWRPLGSEWSMLDKLEFRFDELRSGNGQSIIGNATLAANGDARSSRLVNNFVLNRASGAWDGEDAAGNPLDLYQRSQLSLYYGSKYVIDSYDGNDYSGYTDLLGVEYRFDLTPRMDLGLRASLLHSWSQDTYAWAFGPSIGITPFTNAWVSIGYNIRGFNDRDFESSHYTAEGAYLVFRMKFDQRTLGLGGAEL